MHCSLLLLVGGVLAAASAQVNYAAEFTSVLPGGADLRGGRREYHHHYHGYNNYHGNQGYYEPNRRRPYYPLPYDEHRYPENHPSYAYAPNIPTNYLPNYYNYPLRNPTHYDYGSYWYPSGPGPHPNTNPQGWYGYPPRKG